MILKKTLFCLAVCGLVMAMSAGAYAFNITGEPFMTNSWAQAFEQTSGEVYPWLGPVGSFNQMGIFADSGYTFELPAFTNFSSGGWNSYALSDTLAYATGPEVGYLGWNFNFPGNPSDGTGFLFIAALDGNLRIAQHVTYNGGWSYPYVGPEGLPCIPREPVPAAVPEPGSMLLLSMGILGLFGLRKKVA